MLVPLPFPWHTQATGKLGMLILHCKQLTFCSFAEKILRAVSGTNGIVEPSYVYLPGVPGGEAIAKETGCDFFSVPIELGVSFLFRRYQA